MQDRIIEFVDAKYNTFHPRTSPLNLPDCARRDEYCTHRRFPGEYLDLTVHGLRPMRFSPHTSATRHRYPNDILHTTKIPRTLRRLRCGLASRHTSSPPQLHTMAILVANVIDDRRTGLVIVETSTG